MSQILYLISDPYNSESIQESKLPILGLGETIQDTIQREKDKKFKDALDQLNIENSIKQDLIYYKKSLDK